MGVGRVIGPFFGPHRVHGRPRRYTGAFWASFVLRTGRPLLLVRPARCFSEAEEERGARGEERGSSTSLRRPTPRLSGRAMATHQRSVCGSSAAAAAAKILQKR